MTRFDLQWIAHHPIRWLRAAWFHWVIAATLLLKAVLITDPLWDVTALAFLWPITLGLTAGMCIASSIALSDHRLQTATSLTLLGVAVWRASTYGLLIAGGVSSSATLVAQAFLLHWLLIGAVATRWPIISTKAALIVTVESGRELGGLRAAG